MVEIYYAKKRRGTASLKGRTNGGPPKAYWPGLEIDEYDKKTSNNSNNNNNNNGTMERTSGILHTNNNKRMEGRGEGKSHPSPRQMDVVVNSNNTPISSTTKENDTNGISPSFRSRKRKRKRCVPPTDKKVEAQQQQQKQQQKKQHHQMIVDEIEKEEGNAVENKHIKNTIYEEAEGNNVSYLPPNTNTNNSKELERTISTTTSASNASSSSSSSSSSSNTSVCTTIIANDGNKCTTTSPLFGKNDEPQTEAIRATAAVGTKKMTLKDITTTATMNELAITAPASPLTAANATTTTKTKMDTAYDDNDNDAKMKMKTPTALASFLLRTKLPVIDDVLSNIRDVLLGMVSPSLQNGITKISGGTMSHSCSKSKNNINDNVNHTKQSQNRHEEEKGSEVVITSKFLDVCEQQEKFLERMERMESAAAKREEEFLKRTTERREENLTTELKRHLHDKTRYQSEIKEKNRVIKDLKESKRSIQRLFQSRLDEQFLELSKRETENENLRNRISILEQRKKTHNSTVSTTTNHVSDLIAACQGQGGLDR
jgi:hypothetical protein